MDSCCPSNPSLECEACLRIKPIRWEIYERKPKEVVIDGSAVLIDERCQFFVSRFEGAPLDTLARRD